MSNNLEKTVTVRFAKDDHNQMAIEAERIGTTVADIVRKSCLFYHQHNRFERNLVQMERRQGKLLIEALAVMLHMSEVEKDESIEKLIEAGINI